MPRSYSQIILIFALVNCSEQPLLNHIQTSSSYKAGDETQKQVLGKVACKVNARVTYGA